MGKHPSSRGERRRKERLLKVQSSKIIAHHYGLNPDDEIVIWSVRRRVNNLSSCSCPGCGNARRHFGEKTLQERRAELDCLEN